ncbi:MAG: DUF1801 domain-containing protein [Myxococcaceae bacterium]|nr:DUF1801 domain-containing protein [Myxococcaceae bacterium]
MPTKKTKKPAPAAKQRKDFGAPIDVYFAKFDGETRKTLDVLKGLVSAAVPKAQSAIKWGMPVWTLGGTKMVCALRATKTGVGLMVSGPPELFDDPEGLLEGSAQNMRQLKVASAAGIPKKQVMTWLNAAAARTE